jgi:uncharacterized protein YutE (UPF0331/DUF86 family)
MLNRDFIERKTNLILKDLERLQSLQQYSIEDIAKDFMKSDALERLLEKIVTRAIDMNRHIISEMGNGNETVRGYEDTFYVLAKIGVYEESFAKEIAPSAGLRNRLVHEYDDNDPKIIFSSIKDAASQYTTYCEAVLKFAEAKAA